MSFDSLLEQTREALKEVLPEAIEVTDIELEGPHIVLYTKQLDAFLSSGDLLRQVAQRLHRRVLVRSDPASLIDPKEAEKVIRELIPPEAELNQLFFEPETGEVTIEAANPGAAIGRGGSVLNDLKRRIGWVPTVVRTPPIPSKTVEEVRIHLRNSFDDRRSFLKKVGIRIARDPLPEKLWARSTALGGYREVGRSAHLLSTQNSKVLIDCGIDPGSDRTPFFNAPELLPLDSLDAVVVTHAHLDHCGLIPVLLKYGYKGPIYCTAPTRDLMTLMLLDAIKVVNQEARKGLYDSSHVRDLVTRTIPLRWGETTDIAPDIRLTMHNAGHILGSSICHFHLGEGDHNLAYSGDIKFERSWLFNPATNRFPRLETLVLESTYGGYRDVQPSRQQATEEFSALATKIVGRGGKLIVPVFAVGRSQEVMLVLEEKMREGKIPKVPVYLDGMIFEATAIHTAYPEYLNSMLRTQIFQQGDNPFLSDIFRRVDSSQMRMGILDSKEPCIVLATSGMMSGGPVMEYFRAWASDEKNGLLFVGYQADGTFGRRLQRGLNEATFLDGPRQASVSVKIDIATIEGFSGHSDRTQLMNYVASLDPRPQRIILNHGEESKALDLCSSLHKRFGVESRLPYNLESIRVL
ncbi:MAG TPA: beta-CASP ribonuclease aCPSF1 [Thermoplasmata archaeon]|nr:beta-CASP ribonuclease aCPSF1 [Thermoplasmata archaeon]